MTDNMIYTAFGTPPALLTCPAVRVLKYNYSMFGFSVFSPFTSSVAEGIFEGVFSPYRGGDFHRLLILLPKKFFSLYRGGNTYPALFSSPLAFLA